jgi:quercetin 2,3-dioxygenase
MIDLRPFDTLGGADHGWLRARHHFSFSGYQDPARMNWGALRVWNDDAIQPNTGFPAHGHQDMEIITYVLEGAISHQDSLGNQGRTAAGDVQVMSAGSGIRHAEYNLEPGVTRLFQIWILPAQAGDAPSWGARPFPRDDRAGRFVTLASGLPGDDEALPIRTPGRVLGAALAPGRRAYLVPARGSVEVNGVTVGTRDGAAIVDEPALRITALEDAELVMVDTL